MQVTDRFLIRTEDGRQIEVLKWENERLQQERSGRSSIVIYSTLEGHRVEPRGSDTYLVVPLRLTGRRLSRRAVRHRRTRGK